MVYVKKWYWPFFWHIFLNLCLQCDCAANWKSSCKEYWVCAHPSFWNTVQLCLQTFQSFVTEMWHSNGSGFHECMYFLTRAVHNAVYVPWAGFAGWLDSWTVNWRWVRVHLTCSTNKSSHYFSLKIIHVVYIHTSSVSIQSTPWFVATYAESSLRCTLAALSKIFSSSK